MSKKCSSVPEVCHETPLAADDVHEDIKKGEVIELSPPDKDFLNEFGDESQKCSGVPGKQYVFTFNNYLETDIDFLEEKFAEKCSIYCFKKEVGKKGTPHLQGYICLHVKERITGILKWLNRKVWFAKCKNTKKAILYVQKADTAVDGIIYQKGFKENIGIVVKKELDVIKVLEPWMVKIEEFINTKPDYRSFHWYYSEEFEVGKTQFCRYLMNKYKGVSFATKSETQHIFYSIMNQYKNSPNGMLDFDCMLFNIAAGSTFNYSVLEPLKDGLMFCPKYESQSLLFNSPHIIIFSNDPPNFDDACVKNMDPKRWNVYKYKSSSNDFIKKKLKLDYDN